MAAAQPGEDGSSPAPASALRPPGVPRPCPPYVLIFVAAALPWQGTYSKVKYGQHVETGEAVAVKVLDKAHLIRTGACMWAGWGKTHCGGRLGWACDAPLNSWLQSLLLRCRERGSSVVTGLCCGATSCPCCNRSWDEAGHLRARAAAGAGMVEQIKREITILKQIHHPNVVDLKEVQPAQRA